MNVWELNMNVWKIRLWTNNSPNFEFREKSWMQQLLKMSLPCTRTLQKYCRSIIYWDIGLKSQTWISLDPGDLYTRIFAHQFARSLCTCSINLRAIGSKLVEILDFKVKIRHSGSDPRISESCSSSGIRVREKYNVHRLYLHSRPFQRTEHEVSSCIIYGDIAIIKRPGFFQFFQDSSGSGVGALKKSYSTPHTTKIHHLWMFQEDWLRTPGLDTRTTFVGRGGIKRWIIIIIKICCNNKISASFLADIIIMAENAPRHSQEAKNSEKNN